ncbi:DUF58 domain-containing protein [Savagea faecisuis]|uniref:DUF58 domain-containing protein n=1 Tax=Savagea faecisuis TaxID=1274803 RepID=A0ABW3GTZ7_9BACL
MTFDWRTSGLALFFIALWILGWVEQQSVILFTVYSLTPFIVYALLLSIYPYSRIQVSTEVVETGISGQRLIRQTYRRNNRFPLFFLRGVETWTSQSETRRQSYAVYIGFRKEWQVDYSLDELTRGHYHLSNITWEAHDLFQLIRKRTNGLAKADFYIYPRVNAMYLRHIQREQQWLAEGTKYEKPRHLHGTDLSNLRAYVQGDPLKDIHWKVSAKHGKFVTKQYEEPIHSPITVGLDLSEEQCFEERLSFTMTCLYYFYTQGIPFTYQPMQHIGERMEVADAVTYERVRQSLAMATPSSTAVTAEAFQQVEGMILITSTTEAPFYQVAPALKLFIYVVSKEKPKIVSQMVYIPVREEEEG